VRRLSLFATFAASAPWLVLGGCFAVGEGVLPLSRRGADGGAAKITFYDASAPARRGLDPSLAAALPHSVTGVDPDHGPFSGGQHAIVRGTGFTSAVRVWFGAAEVPRDSVIAIDPGRAQVTVPSGPAGAVDVVAQNGDDLSTRVRLPQGYVYDPFYVDPSSGPVSGGTIITLRGDGTAWDESTQVLVDGQPCAVIAVRSPAGKPQELDCRTPTGTPGAKPVRVVTPQGSADVLDAFVYGDSNNGFRGGISGQPLGGTLRVIVLNAFTGRGIGGATVVLGSGAAAGSVYTVDANGVLVVTDPSPGPKQTVTVAAHCFMPATFAEVPADTVTAYLDPILTPACIENGHPTAIGQGGGSTRSGSTIEGELVWPNAIEFRRAPWDVPDVPQSDAGSAADLRRVAYVFELAPSLTQEFRLPARGEGTTPADGGHLGYTFSRSAGVGNLTLVALAGIENRTLNPPVFTAYTLGVTGGIQAQPGRTTKDVYIRMNIPLDHALSLDVQGPMPTPRGPNRIEGKIGVRLGSLGYVALPIGTRSALLPVSAPLSFVGLPPLVAALAGAEYVTTATAFTGESHSPPLSVLGLFATTTPSAALPLGGFVEVPELTTPADGAAWDGRDLTVTSAPGGPEVDLTLFDIQSGGGLSTWTVAAPRGVATVRLPDLSQVGASAGSLGAPTGPITITVTRAKLSAFSYGSLRYSDMAPKRWDAYATDVFQTHR
jgi:hypothetical protein